MKHGSKKSKENYKFSELNENEHIPVKYIQSSAQKKNFSMKWIY